MQECKAKNHRGLRIGFAVFTAIVTVAGVIWIVYIAKNVSLNAGIENVPFNEITSKSIDTQLDLARTVYEVTIVIIAALWGAVIVKKDEAKLVFTGPEGVMLISSSLVLLLSVCSYGLYLNELSHYFVDASVSTSRGGLVPSVPDIFDQNINYLFQTQVVSLTAGIINGGLTLISAYRIKE